MDGMLSQEEINALLANSANNDDTSANSNEQTREISDMERDTICEISNICMGTAATTLSSLVNQKVEITTPNFIISDWDELATRQERPCVFLQIAYQEGLNGSNILILKEKDVKIIADLMMGGDGSRIEEELGNLHLSAISEAMNQMMGSAATSLSSMLNRKIDISPPIASIVDLNSTVEEGDISKFLQSDFIRISFKMKIGDLVDSEIMQLFPMEFASDLFKKFSADAKEEEDSNNSEVKKTTNTQNNQAAQQASAQQQEQQAQPGQMPNGQMPYGQMPNGQVPYGQMPNGQVPYGQMPYGQIPYGQMPYGQSPEINVQQAQFQTFAPDLVAVNQKENINLIMDVPLDVTVELGRTSKSIQDILEFAPGTIVELDKIAGEPIDVLVNGKYVAKGEVVVIEECYGIRITEITK